MLARTRPALIMLLFAQIILLPNIAYAKRPPKCGEISRNDIRDAFDHAHDLRYFYDYDEDIERLCAFMDEFEDWDDNVPRELRRSDAYDDEKDALIERIEEHIDDLKTPLRMLHLWLRANTDTTYEFVLKEARVRARRDDIDKTLVKLNEDIQLIKDFMGRQDKKIVEQETINIP